MNGEVAKDMENALTCNNSKYFFKKFKTNMLLRHDQVIYNRIYDTGVLKQSKRIGVNNGVAGFYRGGKLNK